MEYHLFISFFAALSRAAGFAFLDAQGRTVPKYLFKKYCLLSDIAMGFYVFRITSKLFLTPMDLNQTLEWISTFLYVGQVFLKSMIIRKTSKQIILLVKEMNDFFIMVNNRSKEKFAVIWKEQFSFPNRFCKIIFGIQIFALFLAYTPSFFNVFANPSAKFITFPSFYYFYHIHGFKVAYLVLDYITSNFCTMKTSAIEMFYLTFVSYYVSVLKYLKSELREIFEAKGEINEEMYFWWVEKHQDVLRQVKNFRNTVGSLLLVIYVYNLLNIATMAIFVTANGDMEANQKMVAFVVVTVTLLYFFWDCLLTDELEALHSALLMDGFTPAMVFGEKKFKKCVMFSTMRCRLPLKITAGGVFAPSCWNFKELMTTTGSFLVAISEVKKRALRQSEE